MSSIAVGREGVQALPSVADDAGPPITLDQRAEGFVWLLRPSSALLPPAPTSALASRSEEVFKEGGWKKRERRECAALLPRFALSQEPARLFPLGKAEDPSICQ